MNKHCRGCIRYLKSCTGMTKAVCEKHQLRIPRTNADILRAMSDEKLAGWFSERPRNCPQPYARDGFLNGRCQMGCGNCWLDWLKQEVDTYPPEENEPEEVGE